MNTYNSIMKISSIVYDTCDSNVLINAQTIKNHLSYETQLMVSFSELNRILNQLQKLNPMVTVSDLFEEERLDQQYSQFFMKTDGLNNTTVLVDHFLIDSEKKQIRA